MAVQIPVVGLVRVGQDAFIAGVAAFLALVFTSSRDEVKPFERSRGNLGDEILLLDDALAFRCAIADWRSDRATHAPGGSRRGGQGNRAAARSFAVRNRCRTFHFSLFPSTRLIAGAWVKVELTGKGQEARIEAH